MNTTENQKILPTLCHLYKGLGYSRFKMNKFEEYDLYAGNKDFLVSDRVITFTDTNGRLMALKPDVTLSIVKNYVDVPTGVQRVYYNENVYRVSENTHAYKEILQAGLECMGQITPYHLCEVLFLAGQSLAAISADSVLTLSHLGVVEQLLSDPTLAKVKDQVLHCLGEKNAHGLTALCNRVGASAEIQKALVLLAEAYGSPEEVLPRLQEEIAISGVREALTQLAAVCHEIKEGFATSLVLDFSLVGDMNYYNGLIFRGFVKGIPTAVLQGGQYDKLMNRMSKKAKAIGFAVYMDLLERMETRRKYDVDVVLLHNEKAPIGKVLQKAMELTRSGLRVAVETALPQNKTYETVMEYKEEV